MAIYVSVVLCVLAIAMFRVQLPVDSETVDFKEDKETLRKKHSIFLAVGILLNLLSLLSSLVLGLLFVKHYNIEFSFILSIVFLAIAGVALSYFSVLRKLKPPDWIDGFVKFLNLSYGAGYLKVLTVLIRVALSFSLVATAYSLFVSYFDV